MDTKKPLVVLAVTSPDSTIFFRGRITKLLEAGFDVAVVCSEGNVDTEGASYHPVKMERQIRPLRDLVSLVNLYLLFRRIHPSLIDAGTPKAGFLCGLAGVFARVPVRIYTCHGLRFETQRGWMRRLLMFVERLSALSAHRVVCVSASLGEKFLMWKLGPADKIVVLGDGSCNGVDVTHFTPSDGYNELRMNLGIPSNAKVIGFVGRITRDKGISELISMFLDLSAMDTNMYLLLCGPLETADAPPEDIMEVIKSHSRIRLTGAVRDPRLMYQCMNLLVLPSKREGLPTVILEASSSGLPVIVSSATGCVDAVMDSITGKVIDLSDTRQWGDWINRLLHDPELADRWGKQGRKHVMARFKQETVWETYVKFIREQLR